ncbi:MAG: sigma-70 family RNA polymerase sigma factor [Clostridiales bacterium]|nr:sigma-70 family RNA polymerase sigma factor [Clostridiales bacterium]
MTDENIIRLYWERDEEAITATSRKYGNYCFSIANNILYNNEDSEECVNDTYERIWNTIPPQRPSVFSAFIGRIVRNIALDRYRKNVAEKRGGNQIPIILDELGEIASDSPDPEEECIRLELAKAINDFLFDLPIDKRVMIVRRYWYADDIRSIAMRLGTSENNVSVSIRRIRVKLRDFLSARGFEL